MDNWAEITSRDNQHLAAARKVRDGREDGLMFIEGKRLAAEALASAIEIESCLVSESFLARSCDNDLALRLQRSSEFTARLPDRIFASIAATDNSQGVVLIARRPIAPDLASIPGTGLPIAVFLSEVNNPLNLGAVLRSCEAAGVFRVLVSPGSADPYSPKALRASMGSAFRLAIYEAIDLTVAVGWARESGMVVTATAADARTDHTSIDWKIPRLLVFGSEAHGLPADVEYEIDARVRIAMSASVESLNLAVAAGIMLFEARRQNDAR